MNGTASMELPEYKKGWGDGYGAGYAAGLKAGIAKANSQPKARTHSAGQEDILLGEYIEGKTMARCADLVGYLGITDDRGGRIMIGHAMKRLGWIRKREPAPSRQWYYVRGAAT